MPTTEHRSDTLLYQQASAQRHDIRAWQPADALTPFVEYYWFLRWDLAEPFSSQVVPQPRFHLTWEEGAWWIYGPDRRHFVRTISGSGNVIGVAFRPGMCRPFLAVPAHRLASRQTPAESVLLHPEALRPLNEDTPDDDLVRAVDDMLLAQHARLDPLATWCEELVVEAERDRAIMSVADLAERGTCSARTLQRRFADYVGASPKWVIQRSRILNALDVAREPVEPSWPDLAADLGFADQPHFIRAFRSVVGLPPADYWARSQRGESSPLTPTSAGIS